MEHCRITPLADKNIYSFSAIVVYICAHHSGSTEMKKKLSKVYFESKPKRMDRIEGT